MADGGAGEGAKGIEVRDGSTWRKERPAEDPEKTKRWGFITAKPSEYLVHCRGGRVRPTSGQGTTCFKWPWDSVAIVPTSLQRLSFVADQVSAEKVGLQVKGLAVYRIADPLIAYRVLNFSYPERAQEKLTATLTEMLVGATRRLLANLGVEDSMQKRKAALADELLREIAPVVGGEGRLDDDTEKGWGVVIDTIEIQDVRVLSEKVFVAMQEPYRAGLDQRAREARAAADHAAALAEAESQREVRRAQLDAEADVAGRKAELDRRRAEKETEDAVRRAALAATEARASAESAAAEAEARVDTHQALVAAARATAELAQLEQTATLARRREAAEVEQAIAERAAVIDLAEARTAQAEAEARARVLTAENLPALAAAVGARFGEVRVTQIGSDGNPFGSIAQAVSSVLALAHEAGLGGDSES